MKILMIIATCSLALILTSCATDYDYYGGGVYVGTPYYSESYYDTYYPYPYAYSYGWGWGDDDWDHYGHHHGGYWGGGGGNWNGGHGGYGGGHHHH